LKLRENIKAEDLPDQQSLKIVKNLIHNQRPALPTCH